MLPFVSVIIATRDRSALLARTLEALIGQEWPRDRFEIVVADNGSLDASREAVAAIADRRDAPPIHYLFVAEPGKSHAVNHALQLAKGDVLAFTDDDVRPDALWVKTLADAFGRTGADFVAGRILPIWEAPPPPWMSPALYGVLAVPDNGEREAVIEPGRAEILPVGANMAVRRDVIDRVGGLRVNLGKIAGSLRTGEDHEFFLRMLDAGCRGLYEPTAIVHHLVPRERLERDYFKGWLYQNGQDVALLRRAYPLAVPHLFGIPRYLWRQALDDVRTIVSTIVDHDDAAGFAARVRLVWLRGYVSESWFGAAPADASTRLGTATLTHVQAASGICPRPSA